MRTGSVLKDITAVAVIPVRFGAAPVVMMVTAAGYSRIICRNSSEDRAIAYPFAEIVTQPSGWF
jgi:hypothetical protein